MSYRSTLYGNGMPGAVIEYQGDLTPPTKSYAASFRNTSIGQALRVVGTTIRTGAAVVTRASRRGGIMSFWGHGAVRMPNAVPQQANGFGNVMRSPFQPLNVQLIDFQINPSWHEAGYPQNLGLSQRQPQPRTNMSGGPGESMMQQHPMFTRVQQVPRARARVSIFPTKGQGVKS